MLASRLLLRPGLVPCSRHTLQTIRARPSPSELLLDSSRRVFTSTPRHRKDDASARTVQLELEKRKAEGAPTKDAVKTANPASPTAKGGPLLAEQTVSNKEQRKADWAIIKDMAHYLWPKNDFSTRFRVGLSIGLLVGAKVGLTLLLTCLQCSCCIESPELIDLSVGPQCPDPVLFQDDCRFHEY
jgi:ATP-binding cassette subfamily B (MDR/TAP) protein 7